MTGLLHVSLHAAHGTGNVKHLCLASLTCNMTNTQSFVQVVIFHSQDVERERKEIK